MQQARKSLEGGRVDAAVSLEAVAHSRPQPLAIPTGVRHADDWHVEGAPFHHLVQGGVDFLVGQISCRPKEHEGIGSWECHPSLACVDSMVSTTNWRWKRG